jgi:hypothetical protein
MAREDVRERLKEFVPAPIIGPLIERLQRED